MFDSLTINFYSSNQIQASSLLNVFHSLPSPYDTKCIESFDQDDCNSQCLKQELGSELNRVPFSVFVDNKYQNLKQINPEDMSNERLTNLLWQLEQKCWEKCTFTPCFQIVSFTDLINYYNSRDKARLKIISMVPKRPTLIISSIPATTKTDFLLYICNCFGIWFGLSFMTCDPYFIWIKVTKLRKRIKEYSMQTVTAVNKLKRNSLRLILVVFCVCGFGFQCFSFSNTYFIYKTNSRIEITSVDVHRLPSIVFCTRYLEVISKETWDNYWKRTQSTEISQPTVKEIFEMTPNDTLVGCGYRFNQSEIFQRGSKEECSKIFTTIKYTSGADICYAYISIQESRYSVTKVTSALDHVSIIYELYLNESLRDADHLYFISYLTASNVPLTSKEILPVQSRKYGETLVRVLRDNLQNYFMLQGTIYNVTLLQAPYDTGCLPDNQANFCGPDCNTNKGTTRSL